MYPKQFFKEKKIKEQKGKCFVAMPYAAAFDKVFEKIRKAVEGDQLGFKCERTDELTHGGHIIEDVLKGIASSEIIIVDLSGKNPNVFYELGIAHMLKNVDKILMITQNGDDIPYDLRQYRHIKYTNSPAGLRTLEKKIIESVESTANRIYRFNIKSAEHFVFDKRIFGIDKAMYSFEISKGNYGIGGAKFKLTITKHVIGVPDKIVMDSAQGIRSNGKIALPDTEWELQFVKADDNIGQFLLVHQ